MQLEAKLALFWRIHGGKTCAYSALLEKDGMGVKNLFRLFS